jgi:3-hydroxyisobutyrate dehydrogenase
MNSTRVGLVGLGAMGWPMAGRLHRAGLLRAVSNRTLARAQAFAAEHAGVTVCADAAELTQHCEIIVTCVTADADVLALAELFAKAGKPGLVVIDTSTIASTSAQRAAEILRAAGGDFIDAPVSGGVEGAKNGKLSVMAGGEAATLALARVAIETFAARITHMGPVGAGQNTKAVNQVLVAGIAQAVCEGLALGEALGLQADKLLPTLGAGAAGCWFLEKRGATMLRGEYSVGFKLGLLHKDLNIVRQLALAAGTDHSVIDKSLTDYADLMARGHGDEDISALIRLKRAR